MKDGYELERISRWHRLKRLVITHDCAIVVGSLVRLIRCAPQLRELSVQHDLDYLRALSANVELGVLLASKLDVFSYRVLDGRGSLADLARLIDALFRHSTTPSRLKELRLDIDGQRRTCLSKKHFVQWITQLLHRFPALIHFNLDCYRKAQYNLTRFITNESLQSLFLEQLRRDSVEYQLTPHSLCIWL